MFDNRFTSTPAEASNTATAPSRTRSARSTSRVKSTCPATTQNDMFEWLIPTGIFLISQGCFHIIFLPGVSIRFILWLLQSNVTAADCMVMPRSLSWAIKSVTVSPSSTSKSNRDRKGLRDRSKQAGNWLWRIINVHICFSCTPPSARV